MSDLRETLIDMAITHGDTRSREDSTYFVEDVLTVVREALLSDAAVEAGARGIAFVGMEHLYPDQDETWRTAHEDQKDLFRREIRSGITAALNAALGGDGHE